MDTDIIYELWEGFWQGYDLGEAVDNLISHSPHRNEYAEAYSILQDMMTLEILTEQDFSNAKRAIRLLNTVDNSDKRYLQFLALLMKARIYALLSHYNKCYECLDMIESMDDGNLLTLNRKSIKELKNGISQFRQTVKEAEEQWKKEKEEQERLEREKKQREKDLYNRIERIDNTVQSIKDSTLQTKETNNVNCHSKLQLWMGVASLVFSVASIVLICILLFR